MKKHKIYKESGVDWIGEIPENWKVMTFRRICNLQQGLQIPISERFSEEVEGALEYITTKSIHNPNDYRQYVVGAKQNVICLEDDVLLGRTGNTGEVVTDIAGVFHNNFFKIDYDKNRIVKNFIVYFLKTTLIQELIKLVAGTTTIPDLNHGDFLNLPFLFPSIEEQTQIANYLDHKTTIIDSLIDKKEQLIKKLQAQRQAIINEAVTKGLNKNAKLKDSDIEWLGKTPEHWEVNRLFGLCHLVRGNSNFNKDELLSSGKYVALQYGKTYKVNEINEKFEFYVNDEFYKDSQIVSYGDTIIISTSETVEDLGHSVFYKRNDLGLLGGEQILLKSKKNRLNSKFLFYSSKVFLKELRRNATGVKVFRFNTKDLKNIYTTVPPIEEQKKIADYIEEHLNLAQEILDKCKESIKKLKSYRQSTIIEAVTGKIDVRDWQASKNK
jgi:type I restriction enzyme S subunit